jgi:GntR family transcriptional repressor for pyruvate dehydrogenase complex
MHDIKKIKAESLRTQVYATLKEKLVRGAWREGEKLPSEHELCAGFGVSRVTVRAALQQLEILGLVETRHGGGTFVKEFSACRNIDTLHPLIQIQHNQDLITVMEYRKIIEKGTVGLAREKITPEDFVALEATYADTIDESRDIDEAVQADFAFHYQLARISGNPMIVKVFELLHEILFISMRDIVHMMGRNNALIYHRKIIDALKTGDKAECEALMEAHIEKNIELIRNGGWPDTGTP